MSVQTCRVCGHRAITYPSIGLCDACYKRARRLDPENAERDREASRRWKREHREENRARDRALKRRPEYRGTCEICGGPRGSDAARRGPGVCASCIAAGVHERRMMLVELWASGMRITEIAAALGVTKNFLGVEMVRARQDGYDLPYRYGPKRRAAMSQSVPA